MKRRALFAVFIALAACRGVIGVEDLKLDGGSDGGTTPPPGTPPPGTPPPGTPPPGTPPPGNPPGPPPFGDAGTCGSSTGPACVMCCRGGVTMDMNGALDMATKACVCQGTACGPTDCPTFCTGSPPTSDPKCPNDCLAPTFFDAGCSVIRDCYNGVVPNCKELATCIAGCKP